MTPTKYTTKYIKTELEDIKSYLDKFLSREEFNAIEKRVAHLEKLLQSKRLKSA